MRAVVHDNYGPPDVLRLEEVERPVPNDDEVLVKVHATTVTRTDTGLRSAEYFISRFFTGLLRPKRKVLGIEFAGEVEAVGAAVTEFEVGDNVFGVKDGAHAEFVCVRESGPLAHKPAGMSFEEAAAVCDGAALALACLRKAGPLEGRNVLVYGASGSVGTAGVQLAKHFGAHVTAVSNTKNVELVRSLGADEVIDYLQEDFARNGETYDVIFDAVGKHSFRRSRRSLRPGGTFVDTDLGFIWHLPLLALLTRWIGSKKVSFGVTKYSKQDVLFLKELVEAGKYRAVIDRRYPLEDVIEATRYVETGQKTGNVVLTVNGAPAQRRGDGRMRAVVHDRYGPPEVLRIEELERPVPKGDEVLVRVHATTVNRTDCGWRSAKPFIFRYFTGLRRPRRRTLGMELAGEVEAVGASVSEFEAGDHVFGVKAFGANAEFVCMRESAALAHKPAGMSFEEAAAVCDGAITALRCLRRADLRKGQKILVYGASGSIGTAGVQVAKHLGAHVTAVCNTKNVDVVRSLGANEVVDYTQEDFTKKGEAYDVIFDAVGKDSFRRSRRVLKQGGIYITTDIGSMAQNPFWALWTWRIGDKRLLLPPFPRYTKEDVLFLKELIEAGKYRAVIDRRYPLEDVVEATRYVETGQKTGNVVLTVNAAGPTGEEVRS